MISINYGILYIHFLLEPLSQLVSPEWVLPKKNFAFQLLYLSDQ